MFQLEAKPWIEVLYIVRNNVQIAAFKFLHTHIKKHNYGVSLQNNAEGS